MKIAILLYGNISNFNIEKFKKNVSENNKYNIIRIICNYYTDKDEINKTDNISLYTLIWNIGIFKKIGTSLFIIIL